MSFDSLRMSSAALAARAVMMLGGAGVGALLGSGCADDIAPPSDSIPPLERPTPGQTGDAFTGTPLHQENVFVDQCLSPAQRAQIKLAATGVQMPGATGEPVDGCAMLVLDVKPVDGTMDDAKTKVTVKGALRFGSAPIAFQTGEIGDPGFIDLLNLTAPRLNGSPLSAYGHPDYLAVYPVVGSDTSSPADVFGFYWVVTGALEVVNGQCQLKLTVITNVAIKDGVPADVVNGFLVMLYDGDICLPGPPGAGSVWYDDERAVFVAEAANMTFAFPVGGQPQEVDSEVCGASTTPCKPVRGAKVGTVKATLTIAEEEAASVGDQDAGSSVPDASSGRNGTPDAQGGDAPDGIPPLQPPPSDADAK